jgi:hypothetical protein
VPESVLELTDPPGLVVHELNRITLGFRP